MNHVFLLYSCFLALLFLCLHMYYHRRSDCPLRLACRTDQIQILSMALHCIMVAVPQPLPYLPLPLHLLPSVVPVHTRTLLNETVHRHLWAMVQLRTGSLLSRYLPNKSCMIYAFLHFMLCMFKCCLFNLQTVAIQWMRFVVLTVMKTLHSLFVSQVIAKSKQCWLATDWLAEMVSHHSGHEYHFSGCIFIVNSLFFHEGFWLFIIRTSLCVQMQVELFSICILRSMCPHANSKAHWNWQYNFQKCIMLGKLYQLWHLNNKFQ
jgi:hypothetical protein